MNVRADAVVVFGITGDLASKKLFPALYHLESRGRLTGPVIGVARSPWGHWQLTNAARKALGDAGIRVDESVFDRLASRLSMMSGDYAEAALYDGLARKLQGAQSPLFYLAVPPAVFGSAVSGLAAADLTRRGRVIVEKPFGRDLRSARELDAQLLSVFDDERVYRMDHYRGKESVEGLLAFRFANALFEPSWNREHIAKVEVTMAEKFGTEGRAGFYDAVGAVRDIVQNHALQVVALLAMERPSDIEEIEREAVKLLRKVTSLSSDETVRGQYEGYLDEAGVDPLSTTETFAATRLSIDSPRWSGVPFVIRVGKNLRANATDVVIEFRQPSENLFAENGGSADPNIIRLRLGRGEGISVSLQAKTPGVGMATETVDMVSPTPVKTNQEAYERLLDDAIHGLHHRFVSADAISEQWRIVHPLLDSQEVPRQYEPGSWGPAEADLLADGWHRPLES
ncbi:glucose-6-phosphate dehydrogenase [Streptomyces sp. NPDC059215]|uniref:glucose-6-phosphate dehydrogenase n=1 Tax=Streptomyces sp. NPDC059215 TaxID=3346772 RepID=UPI003680FA2E